MKTRAVWAVARLELLRGRKLLLWSGAIGIAAILASPVLPRAVGMPLAVIAVVLAMSSAMGPLGSLTSDKLLGHLEFDRCLPIPLRAIATGRLLGAALRTTPVLLAGVAVGLEIAGEPPDALTLAMILSGAAALQVIIWWIVWILLGANARFSLRRLWWVPMTIWLLPSLVPEPVLEAAGEWLGSVGMTFLNALDSPVKIGAVVIGGLILPSALILAGSVLLFASGLAHYRPDPTALGLPMGAAPKRELASLGRGVMVAVARLRLRLSLEQFRRELGIAAVLLLVIVLDVGSLGEFARAYLPLLAALMPGGIALQLMTGRKSGALEGLQHLPQSRRQIALGHFAAIVVMAVPGAILVAAGMWAEGGVPSMMTVIGRWLWYIVLGWGLAVMAVWATPRRILTALGLGIGGVGLYWLIGGGGVDLGMVSRVVQQWPTWRASLGLALPGAALVVVGAAGVVLFASGLKGYRSGQSMMGG